MAIGVRLYRNRNILLLLIAFADSIDMQNHSTYL